MSAHIMYYILFLVLMGEVYFSSQASFYGTSYIHSPLEQDNYQEADVQFNFKSSRAKGLLVLLAGSRDYCIIQLKSGYIQVMLEIADVAHTIKSPLKDKLNNQRWHKVHVRIADNSLYFGIDDGWERAVSLGNPSRSLEFDQGMYVGGTGTLELTYIEQTGRFFRGCIENIQFNRIPIVNGSYLHEDAELFETTLGCTDEFDAAPDAAISFVKETAYVVYPRWQVGEAGSFACWVKTSAPLGLILYNGEAGESFIASEIVNGHVRVLLSHGTDRMDFVSQRLINDAMWHWVKITVSQEDIIISIDYEPEIMTFDQSYGEPINLGGNLYVGGVVQKARSEAYESNLRSITDQSTGGSFSGCIRDVEVNNEKQALADSRVTHGIEIGCIYTFPCFQDEPCSPGEACIETGPGTVDFLCESDYDYDEEEVDQLTTGAPGTTRMQIRTFSSTPLRLNEGQRKVINSDHIHLNLDLRALQVRESQVLFRIIKRPRHGTILNEVLRRDDNALEFTLLDLNGNKISYSHDGSENYQDEMMLTLELLGVENIPSVFRGNPNVTLVMDVNPVNDPPALILSPSKVLNMIAKTRRPLRYDFIQAVDPDNTTAELTFNILNPGRNVGQLEFIEEPGRPVYKFTQDDVDQGRVVYSHTGPLKKSRIVFKLTDGLSETELLAFRVDVVSLHLEVVNNSAARLNPRSMVPITSRNLFVSTNDPDGQLEVVYTVTEFPTMGELQLKSDVGDFDWWKAESRFTQDDINKGRLRYFAARSTIRKSLKRDWVTLTVSCLDQTIEDLEFKVEIVLTTVQVIHNTGLTLDIRRQGILKSSNLSATVEHPLTPSPMIIYTIIRKPAKGYLLMPSYGQLIEGSNFTQIDIDVGLIGYQVEDQVYSPFNDSFLFQISVSNAQSSILRFNISYKPDTETLIVTNKGFTCREGSARVITQSDLYLVAGEITDFVYQIIKKPEHGELQLLDASESVVARHNIKSFLNFDLESGTLQYQHDDSETESDSFTVYATASYIATNGIRRTLNYTSSVDITIEMKNDHKPEPTVNRIFPVVRNGKTPLTDKYLKYTDKDIDFDDGDINFQRQGIPIGDLVSARNENISVFQFTQRDLNEGNLVFKHHGNSLQSRMVFFVFDTDRSKYNAGFLTIEASDPFIILGQNTGMKLTRGGSAFITSNNLSVETNMGVKDRRITYTLTAPPRHGILTVDGFPSSIFTQEDLLGSKVQYNHDNTSNMVDSFNFTVSAKNQNADGWFKIRVYLEGHQRLPEVENLDKLSLEEGTFAVIDKSHLKVTHTNHLPAELAYQVTVSPMHGHLQLIKDLDETTNFGIGERILRFTQQDVNRGHLYYVQTNTGFESDKFTFEVATGFTRIGNLTLNIDIAPKLVPVEVQSITVLEGASKSITTDVLHIAHSFYQDQQFDYYILQKPANGLVESSRNSGESVEKFSTQDIANEFIYYVHDGSDTNQDSFVVVANSTDGDKSSLPAVIQITIFPVNDMSPELTATNSLMVYVGSTTTITTKSLSATDADTEADNLMYTLATTPTNGFVALKIKPGNAIRNFTQANVKNKEVIFVHTGPRTGAFRFRVSDGIHITPLVLFTIIAKPLLISLVNNTGLKAAPGILQPITSHNLKVMPTEETQTVLEEPVTYQITDGPHHGLIVRIIDNEETGTATFQTLSEFTQKDIDDGLLGYQLSIDSSASEDSFTFDVILPLSQNLLNQEFAIDVVTAEMIETTNLVTTKPMQTTPTLSPYKIRNKGVEVREGASITITEDHLSAINLLNDISDEDMETVTIQYEITKLPSHGYLLIGQRNLTNKAKFTQSNINDIGIKYVHDHTDDRQDGFNFTVRVIANEGSLVSNSEIDPLVYKGEFKIIIDPVNDRMFVVQTTSLHMSVVQGTSKIITPEDLSTIDPDNLPSEIHYQLYGRPSNGKLALTSDSAVSVTEFTQEQIDNGDIQFVHDGGKKSGSFVFKITDGASAHVQIKQFTIEVVSVQLSLNTQEVELPQGDKVVTITNRNLNITTNGDRDTVRYNITSFPKSGQIMVDHIPQLSFTQRDIDDELVQYVQHVLGMSSDLLGFTIYDKYNTVKDLNVSINVKPLISLEQLNATTGMFIPITTNYINASELAIKTRSDPTFKIQMPPRRGLILNMTSRLSISNFKYSDIKKGQVMYAADLLELESNVTLHDRFKFVYAATNAQQVEVTFDIEISPRSADYTTQPTSPTRLRTRERERSSANDTIILSGDTFNFFPTTESGNNVEANSDPKTKNVIPQKLNSIVIIVPIVIIIVIIFIIILIVLWKLNNGKEKGTKTGRESPYPEPDIGPYPGSQPVPVQVGMMPPVNVTSIRPDHRQNGHIANRVQSPMVPQVTVTALGRPPSPKIFNPVNSLVSLSSNGTATMAYQYDSNCEQCENEYMEQCRTASPTLKKSQYWV